jgi:hypothetical protein
MYLRLYQDQINEQDHKIMLDVFVGEAIAVWTLRKTDAFAQRPIICFRVFRVEGFDWVPAFYADRHCIGV